eukprot:1820937-Rhodomonas_salina.1
MGAHLVLGLELGPLDGVADLLVVLGLLPEHIRCALLVLALLHAAQRKHPAALQSQLLRALLQQHPTEPTLRIQLVQPVNHRARAPIVKVRSRRNGATERHDVVPDVETRARAVLLRGQRVLRVCHALDKLAGGAFAALAAVGHGLEVAQRVARAVAEHAQHVDPHLVEPALRFLDRLEDLEVIAVAAHDLRDAEDQTAEADAELVDAER